MKFTCTNFPYKCSYHNRHDESGCGYLGYERFCRKLAGNEMLDQGLPATMPGALSEDLVAVPRRSLETGAALRGRLRGGPEARLHTAARQGGKSLPQQPAGPYPRRCGGSRYPGQRARPSASVRRAQAASPWLRRVAIFCTV